MLNRDILTIVKEESHSHQGTQASESVAPLLPTSSPYIATEHGYAKGEPQNIWVRFGNSHLMTDEKVAINYSKQLNDRHINHAQVIIKNQFGIKGLQLTLYQHTRKLVENELQIIHSRSNHWITASITYFVHAWLH